MGSFLSHTNCVTSHLVRAHLKVYRICRDKLYEKRKAGALEVEQLVRQLAAQVSSACGTAHVVM